MNKFNINVIALAVSFVFSANAMAHNMSKSDYKASKDSIATAFKWDKESCVSLSGNLNDVCVAEANGKERVARAELEDSYKPTRKTHYQARVAKAESDYAVAKERCDDYMDSNEKDDCMKEAKAAETAAKADANALMNVSDASVLPSEKSTEARSGANSPVQACAANMQASIAAFRASFLEHASSAPHP